jgi:hypothetical protein
MSFCIRPLKRQANLDTSISIATVVAAMVVTTTVTLIMVVTIIVIESPSCRSDLYPILGALDTVKAVQPKQSGGAASEPYKQLPIVPIMDVNEQTRQIASYSL